MIAPKRELSREALSGDIGSTRDWAASLSTITRTNLPTEIVVEIAIIAAAYSA